MIGLLSAALVTEALRDRLAAGGSVVRVGSIAADKGAGSYGAAKAPLASWSVGHFLASADARHVSGKVLHVNGGAFVTR